MLLSSTFNQTSHGLTDRLDTQNITTFRFLRIAQIAFAIPALISLVLNIFIILSIYTSKDLLKSPTYHLIGNMVSSDIATACLFIAFSIVSCFELSFAVTDVVCRILSVGTGISYTASVLSLTAISIDRYLSILKPMLFASRQKKLHAFKSIITLIWIMSIIIALPFIAMTGAIKGPDSTCGIIHQGIYSIIFFLMITLLLYLVPLLIIVVFYAKIYHHWISGVQHVPKSNVINRHQATFFTIIERRALVKTLIIISSIFMIMSWPFQVMALGLSFSGVGIEEIEKKSLFLFILCTIAVSSSASTTIVNPMLLLKYDKKIRNHCKILCNRLKGRYHDHPKILFVYRPTHSTVSPSG